MSLVQFFRILYARRLILLTALISSFAVALVMVQVLPKRYVAHARVMLDLIKPNPITGQVLGNERRAYTRTQIEIIQDYQVAERVVEALGWTSNPEILQQFTQQGITDPLEIRRSLAKQIIAGTDAELIETSNILQISFRSSNPDAAKRVVTLVRDIYMEVSSAKQRESAGATADWYAEQTRQAETLVKAAEVERARYAKEKGIVLQADSTDLESSRLEALSSATAIEFVAPSAAGGGATVSATETQLETLNQQIAQAATNLGPNHPALQSMQRQRSVLQGVAARERAAARPVSGPSPGASAARNNEAYERQKQKVVAQSGEIDMVNRMTRDIELKRSQLAKVAERASDYRLQANLGANEIRLMGDAIAPDAPEFPKVPLILVGSIGFGAALGICLSLLIEFLGRRVRGQEDLEYASGVPIFAEISSRARKQKGVVRKLIRYLSDRARSGQALPASAK
jgi:uncharacterized protein involved in exopolysaccharide biosynthesis